MGTDSDPDGDRTSTPNRRQLLQALGAVGLFATAGCAGDDEDGDDQPEDDGTVDGDDEPDSGDDSEPEDDEGDDEPEDDEGDTDDEDDEPDPVAVFEVTELDPAEPEVTKGEPFTVTAQIANTVDVEGTQEVELRVHDDVFATQSLTLAGQEETTVTFEDVSSDGIESGEHPFGVYTEDDELTGTITITVERFEVTQPSHNNIPEDTEDGPAGLGGVGDTYGQTFTVESGFDTVALHVANFNQPSSSATVTLFEGDPLDEGSLEEIATQHVDTWPNEEDVVFEWQGESAGTYYVEMSNPDGYPTWFWYEVPWDGDADPEELKDVGGSAFIDRVPAENADLPLTDSTSRQEPVEGANFQFAVRGNVE